MNQVTEPDIAPLTWVRGEIDLALMRALEALDRTEVGGEGSDALRIAQNYIHQVQGALSVVGLDGVTQFAESLDALFGELAGGRLQLEPKHPPLLRRAAIALGNYLSELESGAPHQPLRLYPLYAELADARGMTAPPRSELFFPDVTSHTPQLSAPVKVDRERAAKELRLLRGHFEKGLLGWLRAPKSDAGPKEMLMAVGRIAQLNVAPSTRSFWWASIAFFEGLVHGAIVSDREAQRLCRRIDTQMRRLLEGSQVIAERLVRDVLFHVANAEIDSQHARAVRQAFQLDALIPVGSAKVLVETPVAPLQRALRETLENAKESWNRFAAGAAVGLPQMQEFLAAARAPLAELHLTEITRLVDGLDRIAGWLRKDPLKSNDELAMDVATALLVAESAIDSAAQKRLPEQVDALVRRLAARQAGRDPGALDETLFGETSRHAEEKLFFNQLAREILLTLGQVEQTLDSFFRNPANCESLAALVAPLKQVEGALTVLGEADASKLVRTNGERIAVLAAAEAPDLSQFDTIAHELSALGFFVEALRHGPATLDRFLVPHGGAVAREQRPQPVTIETEVLQQSREARQLVNALSQAPADEGLRAELKHNLEILREDAALIDDARLEKQAREALDALKKGSDAEKVKEAVACFAGMPVPPVVRSASQETAQLIEASEEQIDAELLSIFLEEAHEVLETIYTHSTRAALEPHNQENIVTVRRGFHTLKGSSRMVGLNDFAEAAKSIEFALNHWIQLERDAAPELLTLVEHAHTLLGAWVAQLDAGGATWRDARALIAEAEALQNAIDGIPTEILPALAPSTTEPVAPVRDEVQEEIAAIDLELGGGDAEFDFANTLVSPFGPSLAEVPQQKAEPIDLAATLLSPFDFQGDIDCGADAMSVDLELMPPLDDLEMIEGEAGEEIDLVSSFVSPFAVTSEGDLIKEPKPEAQPEEGTLTILLEELSLTDEEVLPRRPVEEELDLTATLLAPLETRDAIYGVPESEVRIEERELPTLQFEVPAAAELEIPVATDPAGQLAALAPDFELGKPEPVVEAFAAEPFEPAAEVGQRAFAEASSWIEAAEEPQAEAHVSNETAPMLMETALDLTSSEIDSFAAPIDFDVNTHDLALELPASSDEELSENDQFESLEAEAITLDVPVEPEPDVVMLGNNAISRPLFELYVGESRQHIGRLREELPRFVLNPLLVPQEPVIRAAHTLGGISGTARVEAVRELAKALEHALARLHLAGVPPTTDQAELIRACGERLQAMVAEIAERVLPLETPELVAALERLIAHVPDVVAEAPETLEETVKAEAPQLGEGEAPETAPFDVEITAPTLGVVPSEAPAPHEPQPEPIVTAKPEIMEEVLRAPVVRDDIDEQLLPIFFEEAAELGRDLSSSIRDLREGADLAGSANAIARLLHTLKGSARMAGAMTLGEYVHAIENRLLQARDGQQLGAALADELDGSMDAVGHMIGRMQAGLPAIDLATPAPAVEQPEASVAGAPVAQVPAVPVAPAAPAIEDREAQGGARTLLRVRSDMVDRFVNEAGEIAIARTRIEGELRTLRRSMLDLTENVIRLRNQLREVEIAAESQMQARVAEAETRHEGEFDPLEFDRFTRFQELTRMMAESVGDVTTIQQNLLKNLDAADTALHAQGRLSRDLQQALMSVRMVPFDELSDRMYRVVRQTAKELGKRANLDIRGGQIEIDRSVLDKMTGPIEHLLRNAVAHGLETPEARRAAGKGEIGQITLTVVQRSNEVSIELADDGRGLDHAGIQRRAEERGLLKPGDKPSPSRLNQLIFEPGFTTVDTVSKVAGRGVGMDVVRSETMSVGGRVEVESSWGNGARFIVHLPLTLAVTQALLVRASERTFAIPSNMVEQVLELKQDALDAMRATGFAEWKDQRYTLYYLPQLLGDSKAQPAAGRFHWILLLRSGPEVIALHVDELRGNQEIVVKNAGPQFTRLQGFSGATVLADGEISLILNPVVLAGIARVEHVNAIGEGETEIPAPVVQYVPTVMVVDDSLTVRKITSRLLEREGYRVITAKDGVDALEQLVDEKPDVMLLDIEMPRMDGFDLARNIRADERLKSVPIIMITSRMADKHRNYAMEIGVNHYLGKPYNEEELLALIEGFTQR